MTEDDYILAGDLRTTQELNEMLQRIIPAPNNPHIKASEYRKVAKILYDWQERMFKAVKIA